jgi:hypothetical protein
MVVLVNGSSSLLLVGSGNPQWLSAAVNLLYSCLPIPSTDHTCMRPAPFLASCRMESTVAGLDQAEAFQAVQPETVEAQATPAPTAAPAPVTTASTELAAG